VKTILRAIDGSLANAKENMTAEEEPLVVALRNRLGSLSPAPVASSLNPAPEANRICMSAHEVLRRTNEFLSSVFTYQTPRAQRNEVLRQISLLPDCAQSGRILSKVMNKVPVFTRSFVWEALQKIGAEG
jgi:predicted component of type VI protein secretion system